MKLLKKITILLCFLSLIAFVSCSAEDKSGVKEKDNAETGDFPPPAGTYRDDNVWNEWKDERKDTKVSTVGNTTRIKGLALGDNGKHFDFDISKWKKTIKDGKDIKSEAIVEKDYGYKDISIVYYYDSSTLEITFKNDGYVKDCLFKRKKNIRIIFILV